MVTEQSSQSGPFSGSTLNISIHSETDFYSICARRWPQRSACAWQGVRQGWLISLCLGLIMLIASGGSALAQSDISGKNSPQYAQRRSVSRRLKGAKVSHACRTVALEIRQTVYGKQFIWVLFGTRSQACGSGMSTSDIC